ncbi:protein FAM200C-like [Parasteatoda tepidariorum]|uniref:protein FAM200C-like n=1 Tax=Parasteatoda tepidariorum TaxID=114398 RepID=UPI0039BD2C6A
MNYTSGTTTNIPQKDIHRSKQAAANDTGGPQHGDSMNIISAATDGAPAMTGSQKGFISYLKKKFPDVLAVHCVIHRQHLVARHLSERLFQPLQHVIREVNKIRNNSLNDRLFNQLCVDNDEDFNGLIFHTEVRWLSKGNCLTRFYNLFDSVIEFLENKDREMRRKPHHIKE